MRSRPAILPVATVRSHKNVTQNVTTKIDFDNTEIAFRSQSDEDLETSHMLFKALGYHTIVQLGPTFVNWAVRLRLPINRPVKATVFKQFCGGESFEECLGTVDALAKDGVKTMLDYAVEGRETEKDFDRVCEEVFSTIRKAAKNPNIRCSVVKLTGVARLVLLEKVSSGAPLGERETEEWQRVVDRVDKLCRAAHDSGVSVFVDAEESWIQDCIDDLTLEMMAKYNQERAVVFPTVQMYRWGRLEVLEKIEADARRRNYRAGIKMVRGAYMEKEREWASKRRVESAVHPKKEDTDRDFDLALRYIVDHLERFALVAATHNEVSTELLVNLMDEKGIEPGDERIEFSQLYGMGNHLTFNLAHHGYNTSKYVPYGPLALVLPYLARRAQENSSVRGSSSRELALVSREMKRRGLL